MLTTILTFAAKLIAAMTPNSRKGYELGRKLAQRGR